MKRGAEGEWGLIELIDRVRVYFRRRAHRYSENRFKQEIAKISLSRSGASRFESGIFRANSSRFRQERKSENSHSRATFLLRTASDMRDYVFFVCVSLLAHSVGWLRGGGEDLGSPAVCTVSVPGGMWVCVWVGW
jgi:hypothetical protein